MKPTEGGGQKKKRSSVECEAGKADPHQSIRALALILYSTGNGEPSD